MNDPLITRAEEYARKAHAHIIIESLSGKRWPHDVHLEEVANMVRDIGGTAEEIAAAWLHDSVEDTKTTFDDVEQLCNKNVRLLVEDLTDLQSYKGLSLIERKTKQAERVKGTNRSVKIIKLADQISNITHMTEDPSTWITLEEHPYYMHGANLIAQACRGESEHLDKIFDEAYKKAVARFGVPKI